MNSLEMIIKYWMKSKKNFWISFIYQIIGVVFTLIPPVLIGRIVGIVEKINKGTYIGDPVRDIWINVIIVITFGVLSYIFSRQGRIKGSEVSSTAVYELRRDINNAIYKQSFSYFDKHETGQLVARATSDVDQTNMIFGFGLAVGVQSLIQFVGVLIAALSVAPELSWIFIAIPISLVGSIIITKKLRPIFIETREAFGDLTNTIQENIVGAEVVRIFSKQEKERKKFEKNNYKFYDASLESAKYNSLFMPLNLILIGFMLIAAIWAGGYLIIKDLMDISTLITFQGFVGITMFPMVIFGQILIFYIQADASLVRIREVIESTPDITEDPDAITAEGITGNVSFNNVSFGYTPSNRILKNLTFDVNAGKKLAILGTTGSGKSTIINLLPRFYDINEGSIEIDGVNIKKYKIDELRRQIGLVSQETFLFNKSIRNNISFGKEDASIEEVIDAAKSANLHDFIDTLPKKYDTIVGERGTRLSGGQKQRLSIARALLIRPKILILDDSTSSVDVETEFKIQQALEKIMKGTTTFIITQRISTIRNADKILVLDKGRIVGLGTHNELIKDNVLYKQIFETLHRKQKTKRNLAVEDRENE